MLGIVKRSVSLHRSKATVATMSRAPCKQDICKCPPGVWAESQCPCPCSFCARESDLVHKACGDTMSNEVVQLRLSHRRDPKGRIEHSQVRVDSPRGPVEVDAGMVTILRHLWAKGVNTCMSCEDNRGSIWIDLNWADYDILMHKARSSADLLHFLRHCLCELNPVFPEEFDGLEIPKGEDFEPPTRPEHYVSIRFPKHHKQLFERLLAAWEVPREPWPHKAARLAHIAATSVGFLRTASCPRE